MPKNRNLFLQFSALPAMVLAASLVASIPAHAAGDGDTDTNKPADDGAKPADDDKKPLFKIKCKEGKVWVKEKFRCIAEEDVKKEDQSSIYELGRDYAYAGDYNEAIRILAKAPDQDDPRVLNMLGFSNRKSGNMDVALEYYRQAVAANPDYSLVREYLGEAFIQLGMLEQAREQLTEIERICGGRSCDEYGQLASLIVKNQR